MQRVVKAYRERLEANVGGTCARVVEAAIPFYQGLTPEMLRGSFLRAFVAMGEDLEEGAPRAFPRLMTALGEQRSALGVSIVDILQGMLLGFEAVSEDFATLFAEDLEARIYWEQLRARVSYMGAAQLADSYLAARERLVRAQAEEIVKLSARVLPLYPGILALPLVGTLDASRAGEIMGLLLEAVIQNESSVVLIDVTGLPFVGAETAEHLRNAAVAVKLLGASPILVGVSPNMARTMVEAGVELCGLVTLADLASGLGYALDKLGLRIAAKER